MIPISKVPKQSVSSAMLERRKRDRERERSRGVSKKAMPVDAKRRFGKEFLVKLCELFQADDIETYDSMREMHDELLAYYKEHDLTTMWISDEDADNREVKAPLSKKMHQDVNKPEARNIAIARPKMDSERLKMKISKGTKNVPVSSLSFIAPSATLTSNFDLSDDSDGELVEKSSTTSHLKNYKLCDHCSGSSSTPSNTILECEDCGKMLHQKCAQPEISSLQAKDPRFLFVCNECKLRDEDKAKNDAFPAKPPSLQSKKNEDSVEATKSESDIIVTFTNFAAKKMKKSTQSSPGSSFPAHAQGNLSLNKSPLSQFVSKDRKGLF